MGQRLQRGTGFAARQAHQRDLEHETRVGGVGPAHVDQGLAEGLERAHEHGGTDLLAEREQRRLVVVGHVDPHPPARRGEEERVAHRRQEVFGQPAGFVAGVEELAERDQRTGDVFVGDRREDREPTRERATPEQRTDLLDVDASVRDGLVEQRQRVTHRTGATTGDDRERVGISFDAFLGAHVGEVTGELVERVERELVVLGA